MDSVSRIRSLLNILNSYNSEKILIVVSAMGKTTNALEKVAEVFIPTIFQKLWSFSEKLNNNI